MPPSTSPPIIADPAPAPSPAEPDFFCPACGYDLRGIASENCPECGLAIDRSRDSISTIPWIHRNHIGRASAYWRTLCRATLDPKSIGCDSARSIEFRNARRFANVTGILAALGPVALLTGWIIYNRGTGFMMSLKPAIVGMSSIPRAFPGSFDLIAPWEAGASFAPVVPASLALGIFLLSRSGERFFRSNSQSTPREQRAKALGQFAAAPLFFLNLPALAGAALICLTSAGTVEPDGLLSIIAIMCGTVVSIGTILIAIALIRTHLSILHHSARPSGARLAAVGAMLPIAWALRLFISLAVLPWLIGFVRLVVASFT